MIFSVEIKETTAITVLVEAGSREEAVLKTDKQYNNGTTPDIMDFLEYSIGISQMANPDGTATDVQRKMLPMLD